MIQRAPSVEVEILRIPPGKTPYPNHLHSAQWEFYQVDFRKAPLAMKTGLTPIEPGRPSSFHPVNRINSSMTAPKISSSWWSPTIQSANRVTIPTAKMARAMPERRILRSKGSLLRGEE